MVALRQRADDDWDDDLYDRAYYPKKVFKDGKGPRVALMLTDAAPSSQPRFPAFPALDAYRMSDAEAQKHRPHALAVHGGRIGDAMAAAEKAYEARSAWLRDAWRGRPFVRDQEGDGVAGSPTSTGEGADENDPEAARREYIRRISNAYKEPYGDPSAADAIEAQRRRWTAESPAKDAALSDREAAYGEYLDYIKNAWRRPCGVGAGAKR